ncbi:hypothetical protein GCM10028805_44600 [Spirosoma harenae]
MKYLPLLWFLICVPIISFSQNLLGISTSRYGGTNRLYINPALAADSPSKYYLNVFTGNGHVDNNYVRYQAPFSLLRLITGNVPPQYKSADGSIKFEDDYTREILNGKAKNGTIWGEVRGPSFLVNLGENGGLAFTTRFRAVGQVIGASEPLLSALRASLYSDGIFAIPSSDNKFSASSNTYAEIGATYARAIMETDGRKVLLGATAKFLLGYNAQRLINRGMTYQIVRDPAQPNYNFLEINKLDATLAYTTFLQNRSLTPATLFSPSSPGRGFGFDIGLTYIDQYDEDSPRFQLGIALTDVGGLSYKGQEYNYPDIGKNPVRFSSKDFNNLSGTGQIIEVIQNRLNTGRTPDSNTFRAGLPTSLNLTADYQLPMGFGLNLTYLQDVRATTAEAIHQPSLLSVTPRYDVRWLSMAAPLTYLNGGFMLGASIRVGPGWLGSDNLLGLVGNSSNGLQPRGLDIYAGLSFGLGRLEE